MELKIFIFRLGLFLLLVLNPALLALEEFTYLIGGYPRDQGSCKSIGDFYAKQFTLTTRNKVTKVDCYDNVLTPGPPGLQYDPPLPYSILIHYLAEQRVDVETTDTVFGGRKHDYLSSQLSGGSYDFFTGAINLGGWAYGYRESNKVMRLRNYFSSNYVGGLPENIFKEYRLIEKQVNAALDDGPFIVDLPD